ncbi:MAG: hypothetical protein SwBeaMacB_28540 [Shewanella algae]
MNSSWCTTQAMRAKPPSISPVSGLKVKVPTNNTCLLDTSPRDLIRFNMFDGLDDLFFGVTFLHVEISIGSSVLEISSISWS